MPIARPAKFANVVHRIRRFELISIVVVAFFGLSGWTLHADAQTSKVTTEYLMTILAPLERYSIDSSRVVVNVKPGGWIKGPKVSGKIIPPGGRLAHGHALGRFAIGREVADRDKRRRPYLYDV